MPNTIENIYALIAEDMAAVNQCIQTRLHSEVVLIDQIGHYIVNSGGKRLRPVLHLLCSRALGYEDARRDDCCEEDWVDGAGKAVAGHRWFS